MQHMQISQTEQKAYRAVEADDQHEYVDMEHAVMVRKAISKAFRK
jgi:hypothetical protein